MSFVKYGNGDYVLQYYHIENSLWNAFLYETFGLYKFETISDSTSTLRYTVQFNTEISYS